MEKGIVVSAGGTVGGVAGAVVFTALSFALLPVAPIAAVCFGIGTVGGVAGGAICSGKIYDKVMGEHINTDFITSDINEIKGLEELK